MTSELTVDRTVDRRGRTRALVLALLVAMAVVAASGVAGPVGSAGADPRPRQATVMTRNLYLGGDLAAVFAPGADPAAAAAAVLQQVLQSDIPARLEKIAEEIVAAQPDLVALQEAVSWTIPGQAPIDFLAILGADLQAAGADYAPVAVSRGFTGAVPVPGVGTVGLQDRDVILARGGLTVSDPQAGTFSATLAVSVGGQSLEVPRGWASVDVTTGGKTFRVVATHLEAFADQIRDAQALELRTIVDSSPLPVVLLGDLNSAPSGTPEESRAYRLFADRGMRDAWATANPASDGFTCCYATDLRSGDLDARVDIVLFRGPFRAVAASLVGVLPAEITPSGVWPSDHAGVVVRFQIAPALGHHRHGPRPAVSGSSELAA